MIKNRNLFVKLTLGCLIPLLAALGAQSFLTIRDQRRALREGLDDKAAAVGRLMVDVVGPSVAFEDAKAVSESLGFVAQDPDFESAFVVTAGGEVMAYRGPTELRAERTRGFVVPPQMQTTERDDRLEVQLPIRDGARVLGAVVVDFKTDRLRAAVVAMAVRAGLISLLGAMVAVAVVLLLARTVQRRNEDMRAVLDSVSNAIFTVSPDGTLLEEGSLVAGQTFPGGPMIWDALAKVDARAAGQLFIAWEDLVRGDLALEVALEQLPHQVNQGERIWRAEYQPVRSGAAVLKWLVVLTDVTSERDRQRAEVLASDVLRLFDRMARDRRGVAIFVGEADRLVRRVVAPGAGATQAADLHTLKGNCAAYGVEGVAQLAHELEERLAEGPLPVADQARLSAAWAMLESRLAGVQRASAASVEVAREDLARLIRDLEAIPEARRVRGQMLDLTREPVRLALERLADHARALAARLGRSDLKVVVEAEDLRLPDSYAEFWSALIHVLRNAVDHGIEPADERQARGKPQGGQIVLHARQTAEQVVVEVKDDGRGIDFDRLVAKAGASLSGAATREEQLRALFAEGVSSRDAATETSGRGLGMAAVARSVADRRGRIDVDTAPGQGTTFRFTFPTAPAADA